MPDLAHASAFRRCLIDLDVAGVARIWAEVAPHLPQPETPAGALVALHMARTGAASVPLKLRRYSDRWLRERGIGSLLPEPLRPKGWTPRW